LPTKELPMMKKKNPKMKLGRETLKRLSYVEAQQVAGGLMVVSQWLSACFPSGDAAGCTVTKQPNCDPPPG
jgi:hypothetical protein